MRNFIDSIAGALSRRIPSLAIGAAILTILPVLAEGAEVMHVRWENLTMVNGHTVRISLPGGSIVGKASAVDAEALVVDVKKTSDRKAYPKGVLRVPREKLHILEMQTKGKVGRIVGTPVGFVVGSVAGVGAAFGIGGGIMSDDNKNQGVAAAAAIWIMAAGTVGGYFLGNSVDKHWTTIEILP